MLYPFNYQGKRCACAKVRQKRETTKLFSGFFLVGNDGKENGERQKSENDGQGQGCGYLDMGHIEFKPHKTARRVDILVHGKQHLDTNETEDDTQAVLQVAEILGNGRQCEVEGTQPEDGEDVGSENDERVAADTKDSRDGVDGKGHVGGFNNNEGNKQRGSQPPAVLPDKEIASMHLFADGEEAPEEFHEDVIRRVYLLVVIVAEHLETGIDKEDAEQS